MYRILKWTGVARALSRDRRGSVAIEFTMLALPFAALLFAILESCISFAGQQMLTNAAEDVARRLRTGQEKAAGYTQEDLRTDICTRIRIIVGDGCPGLDVDLRKFDTFAEAAALRIDYIGSGRDKELAPSNFDFKPGLAGTKNRLRVFYQWPVITDFMRLSMSNLKGGKTLHYATVTWQNEPFDD